MRKNDVFELLESTKADLISLRNICEKGRLSDDDLILPPVLLKNTLENSRSCLEYIAADAYESIPNHGSGKILFFPYGSSLQGLMKINRNKWLSDLKTHKPDLFAVIMNYQDFNLQQCDSWLVDFCKLNNEIKHNSLSRPVRIGLNEKFELSPGIVISKKAKKITFTNSQINGTKINNLTLHGDQKTSEIQRTIRKSGLDFNVRYLSTGVEFHTKNGINVINLISKTIKNIEQLANEFYSKI